MQAAYVPMEEVKRTNMVIVYPQQRVGFAQCNPSAMDVDRRENRNYYNCGEFGHLVRNCRNKGMGNRIGNGRRLEYGQRLVIEKNSRQSNLNGKGDLVVLD